MQNVLVAMSGGVDSASAAIRLLEKGYNVSGVTLSLCDGTDEADKAKTVCSKLGINHTVLDLKEDFYKCVQKPFIDDYINGLTPNPCVVCNKTIKFGLLLDYAAKNGFSKLCTGHYAKIVSKGGKNYFAKSDNLLKDQSYMLWKLQRSIADKVLFPLSECQKDENRALCEKYGLPNAKSRDSQDICFIPNGDYASFIMEKGDYKPIIGNYTDKSGNILGKHKGIIYYTVGQRKGLGIALGEPRFVINKSFSDNTVVLGDNQDLFFTKIHIRDINIMDDSFLSGGTVFAKIRYSQKEYEAKLETNGDSGVLTFAEPQRAPAPGQSAVFYKDGILLGGGIIVKGE